MAEAAATGWIKWTGGECPVDQNDLVDVHFAQEKLSEAENYPSRPARFWARAWGRRRGGNRIIAYRVVQS